MYKSSDGGVTWNHIGLEDTRQIGRIVVDPHDVNVVYVGALGHAYAPNDRTRRVQVQSMEERTGRGFSISGPRLAFLIWRCFRCTAAYFCGHVAHAASAVEFLCADRRPRQRPLSLARCGKTWSRLTGNGLPDGRLGTCWCGRVAGWQARLRADRGEEERKQAGLYRSDDGGDSWALANSRFPAHQPGVVLQSAHHRSAES